jgi:serine/threonine-protein kinase ATR
MNQMTVAYDAVLRATELGNEAASIEQARLLFKDGHHRKAIQSLQVALESNTFPENSQQVTLDANITMSTNKDGRGQNSLLAKTELLLAKWMDRSGQMKANEILQLYRQASISFIRWDKGYYFLGSYYNKMLDAEKSVPEDAQNEQYLSGEFDKLVIDNYLRSMLFGSKYLYRTVPKVLTLWLDFGQNLHDRQEEMTKGGRLKREQKDLTLEARKRHMELINRQVEKYLRKRAPLYIPYTAFAQMLSRINNPHPKVAKLLKDIIVDITAKYPQQTLWSVFAVSRTENEAKRVGAKEVITTVSVS